MKQKITKVKPTVIKNVAPIKIESASKFVLNTSNKKGAGANLSYGINIDDSSSWEISGSNLII